MVDLAYGQKPAPRDERSGIAARRGGIMSAQAGAASRIALGR